MPTAKRILLIEDNPVCAAVFSRFATLRGYFVTWAETAASAYEVLQSEPYDVVVADYNLTDQHGSEVAAFAACWALNVCFLTGEPTLVSQTFPVFSKSGLSDDSHPIWKWLSEC